ncbi:MAG TPA: alpha/beta fold hydrolase [Thermoanaerobaculia bacterium]|nr:alpha/beta fold hydrolase [Thermoanaerobaculia bacterium]
MRKLILLLLFVALSANADMLKRRPMFGAQVMPAEKGVALGKVFPGSPALAAGLQEGDVILSLAGTPVNHPGEFISAMRAHGVGDTELVIVRGGETMKKTVKLVEAPREMSTEFDTIYDSARAGDSLRRTIITKPHDAKRHPAVLFAGGIGCYSLDGAPAAVDGYIALIQELTRRGFVVMRVEKSGMGDSEGMPCQLQDFENELAGYRAGFKKLVTYDFVDPQRVFFVGHSIGGVVAPVLASELPFRGIVAMSTAGHKWIEYEDINSRRQMMMEGTTGDALEAKLKLRHACAEKLLLQKQAPEAIVKEQPGCEEYMKYPAHPSYMQQVAALDPPALWKKVKVPVLLIHGTSDFVTDASEHEAIVKAAPNATLLLEKNMDHFMRDVPSREASMEGLKAEALDKEPLQTQVRDDIAKWLLAH